MLLLGLPSKTRSLLGHAKVGYLQREVIMGSVGPTPHKCYVVLVGLKQLQINIGEQIFGTWVSVKEYFEYWCEPLTCRDQVISITWLISISWLLMPCLLTSPGLQQPWYWLYSRWYGESLMRHSWFEPISARHGLGKSTSRLTSLGELNWQCSVPE